MIPLGARSLDNPNCCKKEIVLGARISNEIERKVMELQHGWQVIEKMVATP